MFFCLFWGWLWVVGWLRIGIRGCCGLLLFVLWLFLVVFRAFVSLLYFLVHCTINWFCGCFWGFLVVFWVCLGLAAGVLWGVCFVGVVGVFMF